MSLTELSKPAKTSEINSSSGEIATSGNLWYRGGRYRDCPAGKCIHSVDETVSAFSNTRVHNRCHKNSPFQSNLRHSIKGLAKLWHATFTDVPIYLFCPTTDSVLWRICVCVYTCSCSSTEGTWGGGIMVMIHSYLALVLRGDEGSVRRHRSLALRDRNAGTRWKMAQIVLDVLQQQQISLSLPGIERFLS